MQGHTFEDGIVGVFHKSAILGPDGERLIVLVSDSRILHHNVVLIMIMQMADHLSHFVERKANWIEGEDFAEVHIV